MGKPKAPAPPDYAAAAQQQGQANVNSAVATNFLNQADQVGPAGSLRYTYDYENGYRDPQTGQIIPRATATTTLSPEQQRLFDQQNEIGIALNDLSQRGLGYVDQAVSSPIDQSRLPGLRSGPSAPGFQTGLAANPFQLQNSFDQQQFQNNYDFSGVGAMPSSDDFTAQRDRITEAYMQRLQPILDRQRDAMNTRLANQGINMGSEAWRWDQDTFNRAENDQRIAALLAGDQEQQNLFNNAMAIRGQGVNEAVAQGNFFNNAANSRLAQAMAAAGFNNEAQQTAFGQNLSQMGAENQAREAMFRSGLASDQFTNQARQQAIQEASFFQDRPLSILNALRTGNQPTMPQFGNVTAGSAINAAPIYQATRDGYDAALDRFNIQSQQFGGFLSGLASLGSAAVTRFSDSRLKQNIRQIGKMANGLMLYSFNYIWDKKPEIGVMADEVAAVRPEALGPTIAGYATVNYGAL